MGEWTRNVLFTDYLCWNPSRPSNQI